MTYRIFWFVLPLFWLPGCIPGLNSRHDPIQNLDLVAVYPLDNSERLEPSGLVQTRDGLLTVADKVDQTVYRVELDDQGSRLVPYLKFKSPGPHYFDWEGITADENGVLYLVSENYGRILKVLPGGTSTWLSTDLRTEGRKAGLFNKRNAGFEGLTRLSANRYLGAVEREPRGLVELDTSTNPARIIAYSPIETPYLGALPLHRLPDYSGLDTDGDRVFALFRNAHLVVQLEKSESAWKEVKAWSYRHIETDPRWAYTAQTYGQAEGLAVSGKDVFIIFDNNRGPRQVDATDIRPILIHARFPDAP